MVYSVLKVGLLCITPLLFAKIIKKYVKVFVDYMFNKNIYYDPEIEKPRLFFHILALVMIVISFLLLTPDKEDVAFYYRLLESLIFFLLGAFLIVFSWSKSFVNVFIPKSKKCKKRGTLKVKSNLDAKVYCAELKKAGFVTDEQSLLQLELLLKGKDIDHRIVWRRKKTVKSKTYSPLFNFLDQVIHRGFEHKQETPSVYIDYVYERFVVEKSGKYKRCLTSRYYEWISDKNAEC